MIGNEEHLGYDNTPDLEGDVMDAPICIDDLEQKMLSQEQVECPVFHHFGPGVYMREAIFPAGSIGLGHKHKHDHLCILLKGKLAILIDGEISIIEAPFTYTAKAGRKIWYALEDSSFMNILPTTETDVDKIEEIFVEKSDHFLNFEEEAKRLISSVNLEEHL
ncbi:MAG: hypothetical protein GY712_10055 [Oceanicoccus sp.]|uniref:hypothetical protein n=1 Tax=Oceanicoccus sp. TaxID=2691044 RepID=UPI00260AD8CD|nr:hypothetical protein [Oceanicoccus sp.]MCP3908346.1 hypothetical protein [Oceanicoccus sp.]